MKFEDVDFSELPPKFCLLLDKEFMRWEVYEPTTIEADIPFEKKWWCYTYWIPKIKKELYVLAISQPEQALWEKFYSLGIDEMYFRDHYRELIKRLKWMRENNDYNHLGEV